MSTTLLDHRPRQVPSVASPIRRAHATRSTEDHREEVRRQEGNSEEGNSEEGNDCKEGHGKEGTGSEVFGPPTATPRSVPQAAAGAAVASAQAGVEDAVVRIRELQGQLLETARSGGTAYLLAYEKNLSSMLQLTESAAASTQLTWAVTLANNYADFVKRMNDAVLKAGRQALG